MTHAATMHRLREGKAQLRSARQQVPLAEKLRQLVYVQHLYVQVAGSRRQLKPWQKPWNVVSDIREFVVFAGDSVRKAPRPVVSSTDSYLEKPFPQWVLPF